MWHLKGQCAFFKGSINQSHCKNEIMCNHSFHVSAHCYILHGNTINELQAHSIQVALNAFVIQIEENSGHVCVSYHRMVLISICNLCSQWCHVLRLCYVVKWRHPGTQCYRHQRLYSRSIDNMPMLNGWIAKVRRGWVAIKPYSCAQPCVVFCRLCLVICATWIAARNEWQKQTLQSKVNHTKWYVFSTKSWTGKFSQYRD